MSFNYGPKADINKQGWEEAEFPIISEDAYGPNRYIEMRKQPFGTECKMCTRPFTVFSISNGKGQPWRKTIICQTCAKSKNICQITLLDLQYTLPANERDAALGRMAAAPTSDINKQYFAQNVEAKMVGSSEPLVPTALGRQENKGKEILKKLALTAPYPSEKPKAEAKKVTAAAVSPGPATRATMPPVAGIATSLPVPHKPPTLALSPPPADTSITSLYLLPLPPSTTSEDLSAAMPFPDDIKSVTVPPGGKMGIVNFKDRAGAERAAHEIQRKGKCEVQGKAVGIRWGRARAGGAGK